MQKLSNERIGELLILVNIIIGFGVSKLVWAYAMRLIHVSKITALSASTIAVSLLLAFLFFDEIPTITQIFGFFTIIVGCYFLIEKSVVNKK
jgi:drug/metabolite transporter (DMT)-like permease